jgi:hypothetical protein
VDRSVSLDVSKGFMDCEFAGESAFVNLAPGQTASFAVFFANTGTIPWVRSTPTQVDLAICRPDDGKCDVESSWENWNPGTWLSRTRYATQAQATVLPGQIGSFTYSVECPAGAGAGVYRFHGELIESASGRLIHPVGYYHDAKVGAGAGAATIVALEPSTADALNATEVKIRGSGFICTPSRPTVLFGSDVADVLSCSATDVLAVAPPRAIRIGEPSESINVVVTNAGAAASNALVFTYARPSDSPPDRAQPVGDDLRTPGIRGLRRGTKRRLSRIRSIWGLDR